MFPAQAGRNRGNRHKKPSGRYVPRITGDGNYPHHPARKAVRKDSLSFTKRLFCKVFDTSEAEDKRLSCGTAFLFDFRSI